MAKLIYFIIFFLFTSCMEVSNQSFLAQAREKTLVVIGRGSVIQFGQKMLKGTNDEKETNEEELEPDGDDYCENIKCKNDGDCPELCSCDLIKRDGEYCTLIPTGDECENIKCPNHAGCPDHCTCELVKADGLYCQVIVTPPDDYCEQIKCNNHGDCPDECGCDLIQKRPFPLKDQEWCLLIQ